MYHSCPELSTISTIKHGFFTRSGGVSDGIYTSLNCGYGSGDDVEKVTENRKRVADKMGASTLVTVHQIHSPAAIVVNKAWEFKNAPQADALVTEQPGIVLGILTADCLPILFADGKAGVIGAAHAGWKGALGGVIEATINAMIGLGAKAKSIIATIGPAISKNSYEVGAEFLERFITANPANSKFFTPSELENHHLFDLPAYATNRMQESGISQINNIAQDTYFNDNDFFSYRRSCKRSEAAYGRQISVISLNG